MYILLHDSEHPVTISYAGILLQTLHPLKFVKSFIHDYATLLRG